MVSTPSSTAKQHSPAIDVSSFKLTNVSVEVSLDHVNARIGDIARQLRAQNVPVEGLIAIRRGGAIPANLLATELQLPAEKIASVVISRYSEAGVAHPPQILEAAQIPNGGRNWVIVDEIAGSGDTLLAALDRYPLASTAVLHSYPEALSKKRADGAPLIDFYSQEVGSHVWIVYPWERE